MKHRLHIANDRDTEIAKGKHIIASGKYAQPQGEYLGTIEHWALDVYEGSPQEWVDTLYQEQEPGC